MPYRKVIIMSDDILQNNQLFILHPSKFVMSMLGAGKYLVNNGLGFRGSIKLLCPTFSVLSRHISLKPDLEKFKLIQPPPGGVVGTSNDSFKPPAADHFHGSYHWSYERLTAISLIPLTSLPLYLTLSGGTIPPLLDAAMGIVVLLHVQQGLNSCIIDYIPKRKFGIWHDMARYLLYGGSALGLYGIYEIETNNNGIVDLISKIFKSDDSNLFFGTD